MKTKLICQYNLNLGKINLLVTFIQWLFTRGKLSLIFTKTLSFPHKTAYFLNDSHDSYKNADGNSMFYITIVIRNWKIIWKVVWFEYYFRLNLSSRRYQYPGYLRIHQMETLKVPESQNNCIYIYLCDQILGALIYLHFIIVILICF